MFGFNAGDVGKGCFDVIECTVETDVGGDVRTYRYRNTRKTLQDYFFGFVRRSISDIVPVKIKMYRTVECENEWTGEIKQREASITFMNKAYVDKIGF